MAASPVTLLAMRKGPQPRWLDRHTQASLYSCHRQWQERRIDGQAVREGNKETERGASSCQVQSAQVSDLAAFLASYSFAAVSDCDPKAHLHRRTPAFFGGLPRLLLTTQSLAEDSGAFWGSIRGFDLKSQIAVE